MSIAGTPGLILRDTRTVSVVTRYWGQPPRLGRQMHGRTTLLRSDSCGNESGQISDVRYGWVTERSSTAETRYLPYSPSGITKTLLEETFGPPVEVPVAWQTRVAAHAQLWAWPAVVAAAGATLSAWILLRLFRRIRLYGSAGDR